jgi:hypothetical protein
MMSAGRETTPEKIPTRGVYEKTMIFSKWMKRVFDEPRRKSARPGAA